MSFFFLCVCLDTTKKPETETKEYTEGKKKAITDGVKIISFDTVKHFILLTFDCLT